MTTLRQRMIEDMCIRNFASTTQRSYIHYVAEFAKYFNRSPQELDLEAVRQYQLYLTQERKLSPEASTRSFRPFSSSTWSPWRCPGTNTIFLVPAWIRSCPSCWPPTKSNASWSMSRASRTALCC